MIIPAKLRKGDEIRVIAPSISFSIVKETNKSIQTLRNLGFRVTFSKNIHEEPDSLLTTSIAARIEDLHEAFRNPNVKGILTAIGGYSSNQLLPYIDYNVIRNNPKVLCGYSDITALSNAIYRRTGLVTYSGPHFSTFGMKLGNEYTIDYFKKCLMEKEAFHVTPSNQWSNDAWYLDQDNRHFIENNGPFIIHEGEAEGTIIGGNLCTLNLLQGTKYMPSLENSILFIEDDLESHAKTFDRDLQSLIHQPGFAGVKAIILGRFERKSSISKETITHIIQTKKELKHIPVIANLNFGHTSPIFTFPIGGTARISAYNNDIQFTITRH